MYWTSERRGLRWIGVAFVAGLAALTLLALGAAHRYVDSPLAVARAFLGCCSTHRYDRLRGLLDAGYQKALTPQESRTLLQRLHQFVPRSYAIAMHGYANADGAVTNWRQYYVRCQLEEP